jgi:hypothetical protein
MTMTMESRSASNAPTTYLLAERMWNRVDLFRQTYSYSGKVDNCSFISNPQCLQDGQELADYSISTTREQLQSVRGLAHKHIFVYMENPNVWRPSASDLCSADFILTPFELPGVSKPGPTIIKSSPCVPWFYDIDFDTSCGLLHAPLTAHSELAALETLPLPRKNRLLSIIVSGKRGTDGYEWRTNLALAVKQYFGDCCDIFGFGHAPISNKRDALDHYCYSVVLENYCHPMYITEKLVDALMAWCIPIYSGAPFVNQDYSLNIPTIPYGSNIHDCVLSIRQVISSGGICRKELDKARTIMMSRLNLFREIPRVIQACHNS